MSRKEHILAFYSRGPHFIRLLRQIRSAHPGVRITAMVPPSFPSDTLGSFVDDVLITPVPPHSLRKPGALLALIRQMHAAHPTRCVVMFDSMRLRLVALASGAGERWCFGPDARYFELQAAPLRRISDMPLRRLRGWVLYVRIWIVVHTIHVKKD